MFSLCSYAQLIGQFFIIGPFGPPRPVTTASSWPCLDHSASRLSSATNFARLRLGFPSAPCHRHLTLRRHKTTHRLILQKARRHTDTRTRRSRVTVLRQLVGTGFQVLLTSLQGFFSSFAHATGSLSVTSEYLALEGGPPEFTPGSTCPTLLGDSHGRTEPFSYGAITLFGWAFQSHSDRLDPAFVAAP